MNDSNMKKTELIYNHVSLWDRHHAECVEVALRAKAVGSRVLFLSCKGMLLGCPVNPHRNKNLCSKCVKQTERTENILGKYGIETYSIESGHESIDLITPDSREALLDFLYDGMPIGRTVFNNVSTILGDVFVDATNEFVHDVLRNAIALFNFVKHFVEKNQVNKVSVWNGRRSCDGAVVLAAKRLGVEHSVFISGAKLMSVSEIDGTVAFQDLPHHRSKLKELYDRFEEKNDWDVVKDEASKFYSMARGSEVDVYKPYGMGVFSKSFVASPNVFGDSGKKKLAVFVGTYLEIAGVDGFDENLNVEYGNFYEAVRRICTDEEILANCKVVVRWHPNILIKVRGNELSKLRHVVEETSNNVTHLLPDDPYDSYKLLSDSDVAISVGSTMAVEAAYIKKKIIFIGNNIFDEFSFPVISKHQQLVSHLVSGLNYDLERAYKESLVYGYYRLNRYSFLIERVRYAERNKYRSTYSVDNHIFIDKKAGLYLLRLAVYRVGLTNVIKTLLGYFKSLTTRTKNITLQ